MARASAAAQRRLEAVLAREAEARGDRRAGRPCCRIAGVKRPNGAAATTIATARRSSTFVARARARPRCRATRPSASTRDVHRQLAVELPALVLGEVARAAVLDLAAQLVVVDRVDLLARRRADVALLRPRVLLVDALLDLGQQLDQLAAPLLLRRARRASPWSRSGSVGGSSASSRRTCVSSCCCVSLQLLDLLARLLVGVADLGQRRRRQRRRGAAGWPPRRRRRGSPARSPAPSRAPRPSAS